MIEINSLKKEYPRFSLDCSLSLKKGRITGLVGENGAGKSTTFKALLGLVSFDEGEVRLFGKDIRTLGTRERERIGVVLSDSGFSGYLTVAAIIPILSSLYAGFDRARFSEGLRAFGLPLDKAIRDFSTGMKAKLKVLVALSHGAELLILDEPTAGLDVVARDEILVALRAYMEEDEERAILISSHISSDLETLCDDIYMLHRGRIILHEDTDVLLDRYALLKVDEAEFAALDKSYISHVKKEVFGYSCLATERQFYIDNHPGIVIEKAALDSVITMLIKGEKL